jgi:nitroreductase
MSKLESEPQLSVKDAIARRTSCRAYQTTPVPEPHLMQILEAARLAPSACNQQPWRFAVVRNPDLRKRIVEEGFLPGIKMTWAIEAPVHVVIGMERSFVTHRFAASVSGVNYPWVDIGIAGEHLVLAATALGLGTCWIGWIKPRAVARIVGWPASVKPVVVITVGYASDSDTTVAPASRRKPLAELAQWL